MDDQLLSFLQSEEGRAFDGALLEEVEAAIRSYNGENYGDEEDGRSQVVARDVSETTDYMLTSVLDAFVASGRVVEFEPNDEGQEDNADDATEAMHYLYRRKSGYRLIHDWAKAGLLEKIAVVKACAESKKKRTEAIYHPAFLPDHAIEAEETGDMHPEDGSPLIRAVTLEDSPVQFKDYFVPLEEFGFSPDTVDFDTSPYLNHHPLKTISDLIEMGFDPDVVMELQSNDTVPSQTLMQARDDGRSLMSDDRTGVLRKVRYLEEYTFYDMDGDGIAERLKICRVGNTILDIEVIEDQPFEYWCPYPMQGRLIGQSLADKTMDIQRVNTVVERLMLDSGYQAVSPGTFVHEDSVGAHTIDDLLTVRPGRVVRWIGSQPPIPEQRPDITGPALQIIDFKTRQRESRTGITRLNKGVDEDTLNETAKGQAQLMARGQQMERYIIRNFGEGVARLFMKKVRLMRKHGQPFRIRVDGEYKQVDPSQWPEEMEVNVIVGLGSGSKQDRIMYRQLLFQAQTLAMQSQAPVCTWENVFNNLSGVTKDMGLAPNNLWTHPEDNQQPQQPSPEMMKMQADVQMGQQKLMQAQQEGQQKLQLMAQQHASDAEVATFKAKMEADLAVRQQNLDMMLQNAQLHMEAQKHAHDMKMKADESKAKVRTLRKGGSLAK